MSHQYDLALTLFSEALQLYQAQGQISAEVGECWFNRGNVLLSLGRNKEALKHFDQANQHPLDKPTSLKLVYAEGRALEPTDAAAAIQCFEKCLKSIGDNQNHSLYLSSLYHLAKNQHSDQQYSSAA